MFGSEGGSSISFVRSSASSSLLCFLLPLAAGLRPLEKCVEHKHAKEGFRNTCAEQEENGKNKE